MSLKSRCEFPPKSISRVFEQISEQMMKGVDTGIIRDMKGEPIGEFSLIHET
jgi:hypothetical protein